MSLSEAVAKLPLCVHTVCCGDSAVVQSFLKTGHALVSGISLPQKRLLRKENDTSHNVIGLHASLMFPTG